MADPIADILDALPPRQRSPIDDILDATPTAAPIPPSRAKLPAPLSPLRPGEGRTRGVFVGDVPLQTEEQPPDRLSGPGPVGSGNPSMNATISASRPPSLWQRVTAPFVGGATGDVRAKDTAISRAFGQAQEPTSEQSRTPNLVEFGNAVSDVGPGVTRGVADFASGLTSPTNLLIMAATGAAGALETQLGKTALSKLISLGFSAQMIYDAARQIPQVKDAIATGDWDSARQLMTQAGLGVGMAALGIRHAASRRKVASPEATPQESDLSAPGPIEPETAPERAPQPIAKANPIDEIVAATPQAEAPAVAASAAAVPTASHPTVSEAPETLQVQMTQLNQGKRQAVMFPKGTDVPQLPEGTPTHADAFGNVYAYDPEKIQPAAIDAAVASNRLPEILGDASVGMGAPDKSRLQGASVAVVGRAMDGTTVQATATDEANLQATIDATKKITPPGGSVSVEPAEQEIAARQQGRREPLSPAPGANQSATGLRDIGDAGKAIADNMHDMLWRKVQAGDTTEGGQPSALLQIAKAIRERGGIQTPEEMRALAVDFAAVPRGEGFQAAMRNLVERHSPPEVLEQAPAPDNPQSHPEVVQPDVAATGKPAEVFTIKGRKVNVQYSVREADELVNSFQPGYPQEYQPRNTNRAGSRQRIEQRKNDMNFALMADSRLASDGAPISLPDGTVITRNHGTQALRELYAEGRAGQYKQDLIDHAAEYGEDPARVAGMKQPVLTRVITDRMIPADVATFAEEANMSSAARMSDAEVAAMLAKRMTGPVMDVFDPSDDGRPNVEFVRELVKDLPVEEQGVFQDKDGNLSQTGTRIIRNTIFAKAYPDPRALERMAESENASLKNITAGMLGAAPKVAQFQEMVARGERFDLGIGPEIADAAAVLDNIARERSSVAIWKQQGDMFGRDPVVERLVDIFTEQRKSGKKIAEVLKEYTELADNIGDPRQDSMFGPPEAPNRAEVLEAAYEHVKQRWNPQKDLFGDVSATAGSPGGDGLAATEDAGDGRAEGRDEATHPAASDVVAPRVRPNSARRGAMPADLLTAPAAAADRALGVSTFVQQDVAPAAVRFGQGLVKAADDILRTFAPQARGGSAPKAAGSLRNMMGELAQRGDRAKAAMDAFRTGFLSQPKVLGIHGMHIIDAIEGGDLSHLDPESRTFAETAQKLYKQRRDELLSRGLLRSYLENYFTHLYKDPDVAQRFVDGWLGRNMVGKETFRKQRTYPTLREALEDPDFHMEAAFDNPVDFVLSGLAQMDKSITGHDVFNEWKAAGDLKFVPAGKRAPAGMAPVDDRIFTVYGPRKGAVSLPKDAVHEGVPSGFDPDQQLPVGPEEVTVHGQRIMGKYYAPEQMAQVANNWLSPGLRGATAYDAWMAGKGAANMLNLGFSAFHAATTALNSSFSDMALGIKQAAAGKLLSGASSVAQGLVPFASVVRDSIRGTYLEKVWDNKIDNPDPLAVAVCDALKRAGGSPHQATGDANYLLNGLKQAWSEGNRMGAAIRAVNPLLAAEQLIKPIMSKLVPRVKLAAFQKAMQLEIDNHPNMSPIEARQRFGSLWDSMDNRFGQLNQRNMLMNNVVKDAMNAIVGRPGWTIGTARELIGGGLDVVGNIADLVRGRSPEMSHRTAYTLALFLGGAAINGSTSAILSGSMPAGLDYIAPRDGGVTEDGRPSRIVLPMYLSKDVYSWATRPLATLKAKLAQPLMVGGDLLSNRNFQNQKILGDGGIGLRDYLLRGALPYSVQGLEKNIERGQPAGKLLMPFVGIMPAGKRVGQTPADRILTDYMDEHRESTKATPTAHSKAQTKVFQAAQAGGPVAAQAAARTAVAAGVINRSDVNHMIQRAKVGPLLADIKRVPASVALEAYDKASPQERIQMTPVLRQKLAKARKEAWQWTPRMAQLSSQYFGIRPVRMPDLPVPGPIN